MKFVVFNFEVDFNLIRYFTVVKNIKPGLFRLNILLKNHTNYILLCPF